VYVLIAIVRKRLKLETPLYTLLQVISVTTFEKMPILSAFAPEALQAGGISDNNQLNLFVS